MRREGRLVILEPVDEWPPEVLACFGAWDEEIERPPQTPITELRDPFADEPLHAGHQHGQLRNPRGGKRRSTRRRP